MMEKKLLGSTLSDVAISDIDLRPGPFSMSFGFDLEPLKASIGRFGVLNSPYLLKGPDRKFIVVAGYRRLLAARELGWPDTACQIVPDTFPPFEALLLNLNDNLTHRQLNTIEKAMVLKRLTRYLKGEEIIKNFMSILGIPANRQTLEVFLGLEELEETIRVSLAAERLSLRVAGLMTGIGRDDRLRINDLFTTIKWSFNQQWEAAQMLIEIASREGRSIKELIDEKEIMEVLGNDRMNNPQKVKSVVKILKARRLPSLLEAEKLFKRGLARVSLPLGVRIIPPPFFEGIDYKLEIVFRKGQELREKLAVLSHLSGLEMVTDFWRGMEPR